MWSQASTCTGPIKDSVSAVGMRITRGGGQYRQTHRVAEVKNMVDSLPKDGDGVVLYDAPPGQLGYIVTMLTYCVLAKGPGLGVPAHIGLGDCDFNLLAFSIDEKAACIRFHRAWVAAYRQAHGKSAPAQKDDNEVWKEITKRLIGFGFNAVPINERGALSWAHGVEDIVHLFRWRKESWNIKVANFKR